MSLVWLQRLTLVLCLGALSAPAWAQESDAVPAPVDLEKQRVLGVLPNNRTTDGSVPFAPISARQKMTIAWKDSTDYPVYPTAAIFASIYQLENQNPSFGQGMKGYSKRFVAAYGDQVLGNLFTEGIVPVMTHEDPRYFYQGPESGGRRHRIWYAATRIFVTRTDSGHNTLNLSEFIGSAIAVAASNLYYPDTRTARDNISKFGIQLGTDSLSYVMKELWPDVVKHFKEKKAAKAAPSSH